MEWPYDHTFHKDFSGASRPVDPARITVAIKRFESLRRWDSGFQDTDGWVRLVIWENLRSGVCTPHVNVDSSIACLLRANIQGFGPDDDPIFSAYLIDYDAFEVVFADGSSPWPDTIPVPRDLPEASPGPSSECQLPADE